MRTAKKLTRFIRAASEDAAHYATGLPVATLFELGRALSPRWIWSSTFLDTCLESWRLTYEPELSKCITLSYHGLDWKLPIVPVLHAPVHGSAPLEVSFKLEESPFELDPEVRAITEEAWRLQHRRLKFLGRRYANETKLRISRLDQVEGKSTIELIPVQYYDFIRTNLSLDYIGAGRGQSLRQLVHDTGRLEEISNSRLANHVGIDALLFTADGSLVVPKRSRRVAVRPRELSPSGSGALNYSDVTGPINLSTLPKFRETFEELGVRPDEIPRDGVGFLGLYRDLILGGKPQLYFVAFTQLSEYELSRRWKKEARDKYETSKLFFARFGSLASRAVTSANDEHRLLTELDRFLDLHGESASIPLLGVLAMWCQSKLENHRP